MRWIRRLGVTVAVAALAAGCGDEGPTDLVSDLVGEGMRTVRVVFDASDFLQGDTVYDGIGSLNDATFGIVANGYGGDLDAHLLFDVDRPVTVTYEDSAGPVVRDTITSFRSGTLVVVLDTLAFPAGPVDFEVVDVTETWDPATVSWTVRADTGAAAGAWSTAGGTPGQVLGTATWESGDTLRIPLDSAAVAVWDDTIPMANSGMLRLATADARARVRAVQFEFNVTPMSTDTVVPVASIQDVAMVAPAPPSPAGGVLRIGGLPAWRSLLHFMPLDDLPVPCEQGATGCQIALSEVTVSAANLLVRTAPTTGYRAERRMNVEGRAVLEAPTVPLIRSPVSAPLALPGDTLSEQAFTGAAGVVVRIPVTAFVRTNSQIGENDSPVLWLALTASAERNLFGYGEFAGLGSADAPQLEVVATIPVRKVTP